MKLKTTDTPATAKQIAYIESMTRQYAEIVGLELKTETLDWVHQTTRANASARIDTLKAMLTDARRQQTLDRQKEAVDADRATARKIEDGFYEFESNIYKVQTAVHGSGHQYAKVLDSETGDWSYAPGKIHQLRRSATPLTLDRAKELGHLYGRCVRCGRTLTDENSIEAGIGPVCAGKF